MAEPAPPIGLSHFIDDTIAGFERASGWRVTLPARVVLQQAMLSIGRGDIGLRGTKSGEARLDLQRALAKALPQFFQSLAQAAEQVNAAERMHDSREIGAVFLMQHLVTAWRGAE